MEENKIKFVVGLSNGENLIEGEGILSIISGEDSPWWKLQKYLKDNNFKINSLYLSLGDRHFILPSIEPKFGGESPIRYNCFRKHAMSILSGRDKEERYICAEAIYSQYKVQLWVDEKEGLKSWVNIIKLRYERPS